MLPAKFVMLGVLNFNGSEDLPVEVGDKNWLLDLSFTLLSVITTHSFVSITSI
jgi:hypothetical protein